VRLQLKQKQVDRRLRIVTVPGAQEEARRNGVETETTKDKSSSCDVAVTCDDVRFFLNYFGIQLVLYDLYLTRFDLTTDLLLDTFWIDVFNK